MPARAVGHRKATGSSSKADWMGLGVTSFGLNEQAVFCEARVHARTRLAPGVSCELHTSASTRSIDELVDWCWQSSVPTFLLFSCRRVVLLDPSARPLVRMRPRLTRCRRCCHRPAWALADSDWSVHLAAPRVSPLAVPSLRSWFDVLSRSFVSGLPPPPLPLLVVPRASDSPPGRLDSPPEATGTRGRRAD